MNTETDTVTEVSEEEYNNIAAKLQAKSRLAELMEKEAEITALRSELMPYLTKTIYGAFQAAANGISMDEAKERAWTQIKMIEKASRMDRRVK
jgi:DNA-directed RNA polymerase